MRRRDKTKAALAILVPVLLILIVAVIVVVKVPMITMTTTENCSEEAKRMNDRQPTQATVEVVNRWSAKYLEPRRPIMRYAGMIDKEIDTIFTAEYELAMLEQSWVEFDKSYKLWRACIENPDTYEERVTIWENFLTAWWF